MRIRLPRATFTWAYSHAIAALAHQRVVAECDFDPQFLTYGEFTQTAAPDWRNKVVEQVFQVAGMPAARPDHGSFLTAAPARNPPVKSPRSTLAVTAASPGLPHLFQLIR